MQHLPEIRSGSSVATNPNADTLSLQEGALEAQMNMDAHTLELLEFDKVRELVAGYTASSLGKELARAIEPSTDPNKIRAELDLVSEMAEAVGQGQLPPFGGFHDVRLVLRRAAIGAMLSAEQLLEAAETLNCTGAIYR